MATVTKDFKVKSGLVVEGANATVNNYDILTKKQDDQDYIVNLIGGTATSQNTPDTVVKRDGNGDFSAGTVNANLVGNVVGNVTADTVTLNDGASNSSIYVDGNNLTVYGHNNLYLNTNNADIILQPDGNAKIWGSNIATQDWVGSNYDSVGSATTAENNAKSYADGLIVTEVTNRNDAISTAKSEAISSANSYTDGKVADLVDSAPALLDTLNELAAAIADNPNYAADVANLVATKADTTYVDGQISDVNTSIQNSVSDHASDTITHGVTGNIVGTSDVQTLSNKTIDEAILTNTVSFRDSNNNETMVVEHSYTGTSRITANDDLALRSINGDIILYPGNDDGGTGKAYIHWGDDAWNAHPEREIATLQTVTDAINNISTTDIEEGSNLYFTDARAVDAIEAVVPNFTEIDVNGLVAHIATQTDVPTASQITAHAFDTAVYRSAEYTVKVAYGSHTELSKVMITLDSSNNIAISEYAVVGTNGSASTITADVNAGNARLRVTTANNNSVVTVYGTVIK